MVLRRLHEEGWHDVSEVSISEINDPDVDGNWRASTLDKGRDDTDYIIRAIERLQDELRLQYYLDPDSD